MAAYIVAWLRFRSCYVWSIWRRLNRVEAEIADVTRRIACRTKR